MRENKQDTKGEDGKMTKEHHPLHEIKFVSLLQLF